jgi:hypothetical protein
MKPIFTKDELSEFNMKQLQSLAGYFGIELKGYVPKGRLIDEIYSKIEEGDVEKLPPASVRIQRIRESQKEN